MRAPESRTPDLELPARYYVMLIDLLRAQNLDVDKILARTGLRRAAMQAPDAVLSVAQVEALISAALRASGRDDLGFHLGRLIKPSSHEYLGYALMTCASLDEALRLAARYWRLITPAFSLRHRTDGAAVRIVLEPAVTLSDVALRFHLEAITAAFHAEIEFLLSGRVPAYSIYLPELLHDARARYRQLAPAQVHFVQQSNPCVQIVLRQTTVARPLALADRSALKLARLRCDEALARLTRTGSMSEWVRSLLGQAVDHQPTQQELSQMLHISCRTMNRRLAAEGARFRDLGNRARVMRACTLLDRTGNDITAIALQLGYSDAANFSRAFRRGMGLSPNEYRHRTHK